MINYEKPLENPGRTRRSNPSLKVSNWNIVSTTNSIYPLKMLQTQFFFKGKQYVHRPMIWIGPMLAVKQFTDEQSVVYE